MQSDSSSYSDCLGHYQAGGILGHHTLRLVQLWWPLRVQLANHCLSIESAPFSFFSRTKLELWQHNRSICTITCSLPGLVFPQDVSSLEFLIRYRVRFLKLSSYHHEFPKNSYLLAVGRIPCTHCYINTLLRSFLFYPHFTDRGTETQRLSCRLKQLLPDLLCTIGACWGMSQRSSKRLSRGGRQCRTVVRISEIDCLASDPSFITF